MSYKKVSTIESYDSGKSRLVDESIELSDITDDNNGETQFTAIVSDTHVPLSKPPSQYRDKFYIFLFVLHVGLISMFQLVQDDHSTINIDGSWSSLLMIVTLLGSFTGSCIPIFVNNTEMRETFLSISLLFSISMQICLANILILMKSNFSWIGMLLIFSAIYEAASYKQAKENLNLTIALIQMVIDVCKHYGTTLTITCITIVAVQTCMLLWWGVYFVSLISTIDSDYSVMVIVGMAFSLYWITQFFHALVSYVVGGCVLWYFVKSDMDLLNPVGRVFLHCRCALSTSFGTLCKGALLCPFAQVVLFLNHWGKSRLSVTASKCSFRGIVGILVSPFVEFSNRHNKLAFCLTATYGRTLCKAAEDHIAAYPQTLELSLEDLTGHTLKAAAIGIAGIVAILFGLFVQKKDASWSLFVFTAFYLSYCGLSLIAQMYHSAIDALIVSFASQPVKLAMENQIVYLRFLRNTETELR